MDSPAPQQPGSQPLGHMTCTQCGKRFRYKPDLAGRTVKCPCGARIMVPRVQFTPVYTEDDAPDREYDVAAGGAAATSQNPKRVTTAAPAAAGAGVGLS